LKKNKISKDWLNKQKKDPFFKKSKIEGYRSRSAFKLIEMNEKFSFIKNNSHLLDLGCSPGGWCQVANKKIMDGVIVGVDIKDMEKISRVKFIKGDFQEDKIFKEIKDNFNEKINIVLSDMATNTSGNKNLDTYRTGELCLNAMNLAIKILAKDGVFLSKIFMGEIFKEINNKAKKSFKKVVIYKPASSKKASKEIYIFCRGVLKI
jgi:23S rRNA (uridine2552-2'-O)-methyltransferase